MTTLYLMVGYPGAGKTTAAQLIHELTGAVHIWADEERKKLFGGHYDTEQSSELYKILNTRTAEFLGQGISVIFDTNFNHRSDRDALRSIAQKAGASTKLIWLITDKDVAQRRATGNPENPATRVFAMTSQDFNRVAAHLEEPTIDENPIVLKGVDLTKEIVQQAVGL